MLSGASFTNDGTLTADPTSQISVAAGGTLTDGHAMSVGGLILRSGATLVITHLSALGLSGDSVFSAGSTLYDSGFVVVNAQLTVNTSDNLGRLSVDASGILELGPGVTVSATTNAFNGGGTLRLDAQATGNFGQIISLGNGKPAKATLALFAPLWTPACGTTVTALSVAGSMLSRFAAVVADDAAPGTETWQPEQTATTAGATLAC